MGMPISHRYLKVGNLFRSGRLGQFSARNCWPADDRLTNHPPQMTLLQRIFNYLPKSITSGQSWTYDQSEHELSPIRYIDPILTLIPRNEGRMGEELVNTFPASAINEVRRSHTR